MGLRRNWFTTVGGIMSGFAAVPVALGMAKLSMPGWLYATCIILGVIGPVVIGVGAKGQDEPVIPTQPTMPMPPSPQMQMPQPSPQPQQGGQGGQGGQIGAKQP